MKNTTAVLFCSLAVVVAFTNMLLDRYIYVVFVVPFFFACILSGRAAKIIETIGLIFIGLYVLVWQNEYTGMIILYASSIWFFVYIHRDGRAKVYISAIAIIIGILSYLEPTQGTAHELVHTFLDAAFYGIGALASLVTVQQLETQIKEEKRPINKKYIDLLDTLSATLHEMMATIKKMQEGESDDRSRKDC